MRGRAIAVAAVMGLSASFLHVTPASAGPNEYVTVRDGTSIAVHVEMPENFQKGRKYPTIFEMSGYDGGSADGEHPYAGRGSRALTDMFRKDYVTIHASIRGTGCSGGEFDLFSWQSALDGRDVIEWVARQPWSNGDVGIYGHSYGGITGFMVAATRPPHLRALSVSGLIDDIYRGIVYPGGVSNYGFPLLWTGIVRPLYDVGGGLAPGIYGGDERCARNVATKRRTVLNDPILQGIQDTDNSWMQVRSLINYAERIRVPIHISGAYQDEQTGPRGPYHLFEEVSNAPYKRLLIGNGNHYTQQSPAMEPDRKAWMDHWLLGRGSRPPRSSVRTLFEVSEHEPNGYKDSRTFPLEDTRWTDLYLRADQKLTRGAPRDEGADAYVSGSPRHSWSYQAGHAAGAPITTADGPDALEYSTSRFKQPTAVVGPSTATLFVTATAPDTEIFVQLIDEGPDGERYYLQRGMLKASHRAIDPILSDRTRDGTIYRPHRPHTNPTEITPGEIYRYLIEIFPVGHIFRPGHRLVLQITTPPAVDSYYAYVPKRPAGINLVHHDDENPSKVMLPFVPLGGARLGPARQPCSQDAVRCVP